MRALHLTADLFGCRCDPAWLTSADRLAAWCSLAFDDCGLGMASGMNRADALCSSIALMAPGVHLCLHASPKKRAATIDVFVTGSDPATATRARALVDALIDRLAPEWTEQRSLDRGETA